MARCSAGHGDTISDVRGVNERSRCGEEKEGEGRRAKSVSLYTGSSTKVGRCGYAGVWEGGHGVPRVQYRGDEDETASAGQERNPRSVSPEGAWQFRPRLESTGYPPVLPVPACQPAAARSPARAARPSPPTGSATYRSVCQSRGPHPSAVHFQRLHHVCCVAWRFSRSQSSHAQSARRHGAPPSASTMTKQHSVLSLLRSVSGP